MSTNYFAYGSNMFTPKMRIPIPSAEFRMIGRLLGYVLRFNKRSEDGSGKGNIVAGVSAGNEVWGVVFEIDDNQRPALDASEGGYLPIDVEVLTADGPLSTVTYIAKSGRVDNSLRPYTWYQEFVVRGARDHSLPDAYVQKLASVEATKDPDEEREQKNVALLGRK